MNNGYQEEGYKLLLIVRQIREDNDWKDPQQVQEAICNFEDANKKLRGKLMIEDCRKTLNCFWQERRFEGETKYFGRIECKTYS
ncbi:hypothetical protein [Thermincola ferriacetica]